MFVSLFTGMSGNALYTEIVKKYDLWKKLDIRNRTKCYDITSDTSAKRNKSPPTEVTFKPMN